MNAKAKSISIVIINLAILFSTYSAFAITAAELQNLKILGCHFTTTLSTEQEYYYVMDPSKSRYMVLKLSASLSAVDGKLFTNDFVLRYFRSDGKEARIDCKAIARAESSELGENSQFYPGSGSWIKVYGGTVYFCLVFFMQNDVSSIDLHRIGISELISYRIGSDRSYSVYIASNSNPKILAATEELIRNGGYYVRTTNGLDEEETGITIHYQDKVETQAREISQRLMTQLGVVPAIKKMELITDFDIVVWLGK